MKKSSKRGYYLIFFAIISLLLVSTASAGWIDWVKRITGKATSQTFDLNITVGGPSIYRVGNSSVAVDIRENTTASIVLNFSVYAPVGSDNLNHSTARINLTFNETESRINSSCKLVEADGDYANYTCNITLWYWDINETWTIEAFIKDNSSTRAINDTVKQNVGTQRSMQGGPGTITWLGMSPGDSNQTSSNDPYTMQNIGNVPVANISINSTHLRGETDDTEGLWAGNFSVGTATGGTPPAECGGTSATTMKYNSYVQLAVANLTRGNYSINDEYTGKEKLYFCIKETQSNLTTQAYSTSNESKWTVVLAPP